MQRKSFLKSLFGGIAAVFVAPKLVQALPVTPTTPAQLDVIAETTHQLARRAMEQMNNDPEVRAFMRMRILEMMEEVGLTAERANRLYVEQLGRRAAAGDLDAIKKISRHYERELKLRKEWRKKQRFGGD